MPKDPEVTWVEDDICVCNNCGAFADCLKNILHCKSCVPEEFKKLGMFFANEEGTDMSTPEEQESMAEAGKRGAKVGAELRRRLLCPSKK